MDSHRGQLEEQLRGKEIESFEMRESLRDLRRKFGQLEQAFGNNLKCQRQRESELNRLEREGEELRKVNDETLKARVEVNTRLIDAINERDHWRNAFLRQEEFIKRCKADREKMADSVKRECEDILKNSRKSAEKHFRELIEVYKASREKANRFQEMAKVYEINQREHENRSFELANLLQTFKHFDTNVTPVCQLVGEDSFAFVETALKNLTVRGNSFEENLRNLRHLTWLKEAGRDSSESIMLKKQNFVLREIVKDLKRKLQGDVPEREDGRNFSRYKNGTRQRNINDDIIKETMREKNSSCIVQSENHSDDNSEMPENKLDTKAPKESLKHDSAHYQIESLDNDCEVSDNERKARIFCVESHANGAAFEEFTLKFTNNRQIKIKHPLLSDTDGFPIKMEFLDDENEYEKGSPDGMLILLRNIYASVNVKKTGTPCATQTARIKNCNNSTQTRYTGLTTISRLNVGVTMLNTEKRAIERSLRKLERTVSDLKFNALDQARAMIGKDSQCPGKDEFAEYIRSLTQY